MHHHPAASNMGGLLGLSAGQTPPSLCLHSDHQQQQKLFESHGSCRSLCPRNATACRTWSTSCVDCCRLGTCWAWAIATPPISCWTDTAASCCTLILATASRPGGRAGLLFVCCCCMACSTGSELPCLLLPRIWHSMPRLDLDLLMPTHSSFCPCIRCSPKPGGGQQWWRQVKSGLKRLFFMLAVGF